VGVAEADHATDEPKDFSVGLQPLPLVESMRRIARSCCPMRYSGHINLLECGNAQPVLSPARNMMVSIVKTVAYVNDGSDAEGAAVPEIGPKIEPWPRQLARSLDNLPAVDYFEAGCSEG
jgi:hypothetical protein